MTSATKYAALDELETTARAGAPEATLVVHDGLAAARADWERLAANGRASPYQAFAWQHAFARHALAPGARVRVAVLHEARTGHPILVLPLALCRHGPVTIAAPLGGKHANFHLPLVCPQARAHLAPDAVRGHLAAIGRALDVDAFAFLNLPRTWAGEPNPLALPGARRAASDAYWSAFADRDPDGPAAPLSGETRKKLRKKERGLAALGAVTVSRATTRAEAERTLDAFLAFKARRMRAQGLPDPFADPATRAFLHAACDPESEGGPAISLWRLGVGDRIVATFGAACDGVRASGMFTAFDEAPEIARATPGDILMLAVVEELRVQGYESFDLGVGEARYKGHFCDRIEEMLELTVPVTLVGRAWAVQARVTGRLKRWAKGSPRVMAALAAARRLTRRG
ncbi:GNAT family N-acetyltransferase [Salinarimonas rosea]|uniref:GNAT family N-acetyltransferase n=1 Tax=Salinarimonas rosea TaxID=552063 RepID=UPI0004031D04|nr:GNAT family N-acetyltransferase [Salinarimonas rosea]